MSVDLTATAGETDAINSVSDWTTRGFWAIVDQALFALSNLLINVLLARWLSPREYGAFVTAYVVLILVSVAHTALLVEPMTVVGPSRFARGFREYFSFILRFQWMFGAAAASTLLLVGAAVSAWGDPLLGSAFVGVAVAAPFIFLSWLARRACYIERKPVLAALGGAAYLVIAGLGAVVLYQLDLLTTVSAQFLMAMAAAVAAGIILRRLGQPWFPPAPVIETRALVREHWNFLRWSGGAGALSFTQGMAFYLVLPLFGGLEASATLRAMVNLVMPVLQSDAALAGLIAPELARARTRPNDLSRMFRWSTRLFALEGVICWVLLAVFRHDLVRFTYGDRYAAYADLLLLLGALPLVAGRGNMLGALLRVYKNVRLLFWTTAVAAALAMLVGLSTMATLGAYGAVIATLGSELVRVGLMTYFVGRPGFRVAADEDTSVATANPPAAGSPRVAEARQ
jgi:O-antigen/teichoic acid export membrane protein